MRAVRAVTKINRTMSAGFHYKASNEPILSYLDQSQERAELVKKLKKYDREVQDVPIVIGDQEFRSGDVRYQLKPHNHQSQLAKFYYADQALLKQAIDTSQKALKDWELIPLEKRSEIFIKAADLVRGKYRMDLVATTMLGQGKTIVQAEIDAACELADFYSFNVQWALESKQWQPISVGHAVNSLEWRAVEGFWAAISPFNFTAIGGHLAGAPAFMGNTVLWKPSDTAVLSNFLVFKLLREAGVPPGVINFVPSDGPVFGEVITSSPHLAGVNFTGGSKTFETIWSSIGKNISNYRTFPRIIGECGGKNYHLVHPSSAKDDKSIEHIVNCTVRSAFEYSGQKCSACSRLYVPASAYEPIRDLLVATTTKLKLGSPLEADTFLSAVIDKRSFDKIKSYVDMAGDSPSLKVLKGGKCDDRVGYYIEPTIIETTDPLHTIMKEEIFGPVLTVYSYKDEDFDEIIDMIDTTTPYALTGAIFCDDPEVLAKAKTSLRHSSGNFYVNDKSTGAVVAQQPFGGSRKSGTNDKAGNPQYIMRFVNMLSVKTQNEKLDRVDYDYMRQPLKF